MKPRPLVCLAPRWHSIGPGSRPLAVGYSVAGRNPEVLMSSSSSVKVPAGVAPLMEAVGKVLGDDIAYDLVTAAPTRVEGHAADAPEGALYRLEYREGKLWVAWVSPDRYLSQSIEAVLVFTGDDLDDMIDEELVDLGWERGRLAPNEHFRDEDKLFTFRSALPIDPAALDAGSLKALATDGARAVNAYRIAFSELGDMDGGEDED